MRFKSIPVFVVNLQHRFDRKRHIEREFSSRTEFEMTIVNAHTHKTGAVGLWNTIQFIFSNVVDRSSEVVIICEDDHQFTSEYSKEGLFACIEEAKEKGADILSGGVSGFTSALQVSPTLFWVEKFSGLQFTVVFNAFFDIILGAKFTESDAADYKVCSLTNNKYFIYPFISIQRDFGYSDATLWNDRNGSVEKLFWRSTEKVRILKNVSSFYAKNDLENNRRFTDILWNDIKIPTYVVCLSENERQRTNIEKEFLGRSEFDVVFIEARQYKIESFNLWLSIRKIVSLAIANNDDVIIICEDNHRFTKYYSKGFLIRNLLEAHQQHADYLSGGTINFEVATPISENLFWVNQSLSTQFIIIYRKFFKSILNESFDDSVVPGLLLSGITSNKMLLHPFISIQEVDFYSNTVVNCKPKECSEEIFFESNRRLEIIKDIYLKYPLAFRI